MSLVAYTDASLLLVCAGIVIYLWVKRKTL